MTDAVWRTYPDKDAQAEGVAARLAAAIGAALAARGNAVAAVPGGGSAGPMLKALAGHALDWHRVTILPGDDRIVPTDDPLSNYRLLRETLGGVGARLVPLVEHVADRHAAATAVNDRLRALGPLDLVWLGMGDGNGHTASIFHGPDYEAALAGPGPFAGVLPDPLPPEAPVARVTLTAPAIAAAGLVLVTIAGAAKRVIIDRALAEGTRSEYPIGRVLAGLARPPEVHWAEG